MKTTQIPYVCPVCHGSGEGPKPEPPKREFEHVAVGDVIKAQDEQIIDDKWAPVPVSYIGSIVEWDQSLKYRRRIVPEKSVCKACDGACVLWGTQIDDAVSIMYTLTITTDKLPYIPWPYIPWPYTPPTPYVGDWPYTPPYYWTCDTTVSAPISATQTPKVTYTYFNLAGGASQDIKNLKNFRVIKREDYPLNYGF